MQDTVPLGAGAMAAIVGLSDDVVLRICEEVSSDHELVTPANYNAIGQVVIAGHSSAVNKALMLAQDNEARLAVILPVSVPCHCPLLANAAELFAEALHQAPFKVPELPVISNVDLSVYDSTKQIRDLLKEQLYRPVRWVETIQFMTRVGVDLVVECGPGKVLSGLVKRIDNRLKVINVSDPLTLDAAVASFLG